MDAERLKGNNTSETGSAVQEVDQAEELKMAAVPREGHKEPSEEWSEEDGDEFEDASDGQLKSPPKVLRGEQSAVFDVEEAKEQEAITDILMQDAQGQGTEDKEEVETTTNPRRRARFTEKFDKVNEERRKANQRKPLRKNAVRYDLQLRVPPTDPAQALDALKGVLLSVWKILKEADKKLVLYPWSNSEESRNLPGLTKIDEMPGTLSGIQAYFDRAFPRKQGGVIYVSVFLGHDRSFKDMMSDYRWWFLGQGFGWYVKALQCEKSIVIGWLLYSTIDMDKEMLASEILKATGVKVGLGYRTISVSSKETLRKEQVVKAIHIEIDDRNYFGDNVRVEDLYRATSEEFPLEIKLRYAPRFKMQRILHR